MKDKVGHEHSESNGQFVSNGVDTKKDASKDTPAEIERADKLLNNSSSKTSSELKDNEIIEDIGKILGKEFTGFKGQDAIDKLVEEKQGYIKGALHREDIGDIDILWGNDNLGLQHIIRHREEQGIDTKEFIKDLAEVVEKGEFLKKNDRGNFEILYQGRAAIIAPEYHGNKITFLLTAYKTRKK